MRLRGVITLKKRKEFMCIRLTGRSVSVGGLLLQAGEDLNCPEGGFPIRVGFVVSKKSGNAVARNRIRRRFRVVAQDVVAGCATRGFCYVLVSSSRLSAIGVGSLRSCLISCLRRLGLYTPQSSLEG
ncbi:MAG: ribonuclease P protein component [Anaplasma sp.]